MRPRISIPAVTLCALLAVGLPAVSSAQSTSDYTAALMAGLGGSTESNPDTGFDDFGFQALFSMKTVTRTSFQVRAGQLELDVDDDPLGLLGSDLSYVSLGGHYTFPSEVSYESGFFAALGAYDLSGDALIDDETSWGISLGVTGDFRVSERWSVWAELSGHYTELDTYQYFAMAHVGLAFHF